MISKRPSDYAQALKSTRLVADQGFAFGQYQLGTMYAKGQGVPQNFVLAHMWLNLAAAQGYADAVSYRERVAAQMTPDQIAEAQRLAREWKLKTQP